jgi:methylenetetrahydrofolate reductase (NADPH)
MLVDCHYLGINNIMALRGDAMKDEQSFIPKPGGNYYAAELVSQIHQLNQGKYLHEFMDSDNKADFCIGVAGYPEKHLESPSLISDLKRLKEKVDAGADYVVTQMFFDNVKYFEFVAKAREIGITVPIIPGIKPIAVMRHLQILPQIFRIDLPEDLINAVEKCKSPADIRQVGIEWAIQQSLELKAAGVPVLHYYSMGKSENIRQIATKVF